MNENKVFLLSLSLSTVVIPLRLIATFSPLMSLSLRTHRSSPPLSLFLFLKSYPFPLSPHLMQCLLAHFRFIIAVIVSLFLFLWPRYLLTHFLSLRLLLPWLCLLLLTYLLLFGKVINLLVTHPIYNFLSYHRLSSPYSAFVSAISSVSLPKSTPEALSHPG